MHISTSKCSNGLEKPLYIHNYTEENSLLNFKFPYLLLVDVYHVSEF